MITLLACSRIAFAVDLNNVPPSKDTYLSENAGSSNYGSSTSQTLGNVGCGTCTAALLLQYDLSSIPTTATVTTVTLSFQKIATNHSGSKAVALRRHTSTWTESSATWNNTSPLSDQSLGSASIAAGSSFPTITDGALKTLVQEWITDPASNRGLAITPGSTEQTYISFHSKESTTGNAVRLSVSYSVPAACSLTLIAPNGGQTLTKGTAYSVTWNAAGTCSPLVNVDLLKAGSFFMTVGNNVTNNGSYSWTVPATIAAGSDYKLRVVTGTATDSSDNNFTIADMPTCALTLTKPVGGETWIKGQVHDITWTRSGTGCASTLTIELLKGASVYATITAAGIAANNLFSHTVPTSYATGSDYKIRIRDNATSTTATSSSNFTIDSAPAPPQDTSSLRISSGTLAGQSLSSSSTSITVAAGAPITGSIVYSITSTFGSNAVMSIGMTPSWGNHSSSYTDLGHFSTPATNQSLTAPVNYTAPTTPGTYYILAAFNGEFNAGQVLSCTNWSRNGGIVWNDGNDVADWSSSQVSAAKNNGRAPGQLLFDSGMTAFNVPAAALTVTVTTPTVCALTLTKPVGGETWSKGQIHDITWTRSGSGCASTLTIELLKGGSVYATITTAGTAANHLFSHTVPTSYATGSDYKIRIRDNATSTTATSSSNFTIDSAPAPPQDTSSLRISSGTLAGQSLSSSSTSITVAAGAPITGSIVYSITSTFGSNAVMSIGMTPSWGSNSSSYIDLGNFSTPTANESFSTSVSLVAPSTPGTYYILAAFNGEFDAGQVLSCTNWSRSGGVVWNDGNDVADWNSAQISAAKTNGRAPAQILYDDGMHASNLPAAAITVTVTQAPANCTLTLTKPAGGETWIKGQSQDITWARSGTSCGNTLIVELLKNGALYATITSGATAANNFLSHTPATSYADGSDYRVRIRDNTTGVSSTSNDVFSINSAALPPQDTSSLRVSGGTLAGQALSSSDATITVAPGVPITGSIVFSITSTFGSNAVMSIGMTPSWGSPSSSFTDLGHFFTPATNQSLTASVSLIAPTSPGTYSILAAFNGEFNAGQVMSCTNWSRSGGVVWNDGNDVANWNSSQVSAAKSNGRAPGQVLYDDGFHPSNIPGTAVTVIVRAAGVPTASLTASPAAITAGEPVTLDWNTSNSTSVSIDNGVGPVGASGSVEVFPQVTTRYTITALGSSSATASASVTVNPAPNRPILASIQAIPKDVPVGSPVLLTWETSGASAASISNLGSVSLQGSRSVTPTRDTTYTLTATEGSRSQTSDVFVNVRTVPKPTISVFSATPDSVEAGQAVTLHWSSTGGSSATLDGGDVPVNGTTTVRPAQARPYTYTLVVTGAGGLATKTASVTVGHSSAPHVETFSGQPEQPGSRDGAGGTAQFNNPSGIGVDGFGNVFVIDSGNHTIRRISSAGTNETWAGEPGVSGFRDGCRAGCATTATFNFTNFGGAILVRKDGSLVVTDASNRIRFVNKDGRVTTCHSPSCARFSVGSMAEARDGSGMRYESDTGGNTILKVAPSEDALVFAGKPGEAGYVDGPAPQARFRQPRGIAVDNAGNVYVGDTGNNAIRKISPNGTVITLAASSPPPGPIGTHGASGARFSFGCCGGQVVVNPTNGTVYVSDTGSNTIKEVSPEGEVSTIVGSGEPGSEDGVGSRASFKEPLGSGFTPDGRLVIADTGNHTIRTTSPVIATPGVCVVNTTTACMLNGRFRVTLRYRNGFDGNSPDTNARVKAVSGFASSGFETSFFYFNDENNIEMMVKILDQGNTNSKGERTVALLYGSATPLHAQLSVTDTVTGTTKTYSSAFNSMRGQTDFTAFVK